MILRAGKLAYNQQAGLWLHYPVFLILQNKPELRQLTICSTTSAWFLIESSSRARECSHQCSIIKNLLCPTYPLWLSPASCMHTAG